MVLCMTLKRNTTRYKRTPSSGDGTQAKPFIHVDDVVEGILHAINKLTDQCNVIQVGNEQQISMREVAVIILKELNLDTKIIFSDSVTTWAGDVGRYRYDVTKLKSLGWAQNGIL